MTTFSQKNDTLPVFNYKNGIISFNGERKKFSFCNFVESI